MSFSPFQALCSLELHNRWLQGTAVMGGLGGTIFHRLGGEYSTEESHSHDGTVSSRPSSNLMSIGSILTFCECGDHFPRYPQRAPQPHTVCGSQQSLSGKRPHLPWQGGVSLPGSPGRPLSEPWEPLHHFSWHPLGFSEGSSIHSVLGPADTHLA